MIARLWRGRATHAKAPDYERHFRRNVLPELAAIPGQRGAYLLKRESAGQIEFVALTLWDSIDCIKGFAGDQPETAVVEPEARAALSDFDDFARHYEVVAENDGG